MPEEENKPDIGPPRISFATFLLKVLAGAAGGVGGTLILVVIFFLASAVFQPITSGLAEGESVSPIFIFVLMMMIFLSSTTGNIVSTWLMALSEKDKYTRLSSAIYQVFIVSVIIFILMVPVYFITATSNISITAYAIALHIIISAQVSALILEIVSNYKHALIGVYGVTFSILISAGLMFGLGGFIKAPQILLFIALPVVWGSIAFVQSLTTVLYGWIARMYDKDFLSTQTMYGQDYGNEVESVEEVEAPKAEDEAGSDFLRHN
ncbi:MAG: hypothetical protein O3B47_04050 [bacterium]|nr:hypothetical protein [bacterium]